MISQSRFLLFLLAAMLFSLFGYADFAFRLEEVTALPETTRLPVGVFLSGPGEITGMSLKIRYTKIDLAFVEAKAPDDLSPYAEVIHEDDPEHGIVTLGVTFSRPISVPAEEILVLTPVFFLGGGLAPGSVLTMAFEETPSVTVDGSPVPAPGADGAVKIPDENVLLLTETWGYPGQTDVPMELKVFNKDPLMGLQVSCAFDSSLLRLREITEDNTMTEALHAEFFQPVISNDEGFFVLGILLEEQPPVDPTIRYPVTGYRLRLARLRWEVKSDAQPDQAVPVRFEDGLHTPPIKNRVVVNHQSVVPVTLDGSVYIGKIPVFLRGNPNLDNIVNIADPVRILEYLFRDKHLDCVKAADADDDGEVRIDDALYMLDYLFMGGPIIPPPFPEAGTDPTPDDLSCEKYEEKPRPE